MNVPCNSVGKSFQLPLETHFLLISKYHGAGLALERAQSPCALPEMEEQLECLHFLRQKVLSFL